MKCWLIILFFFLMVTQIGFAQWYQQYTDPGISLNAVYFTDSSNGWVAGNDGTIICTNNGGYTWQPQVSGTTNSLNDLCFIDGGTGYAVGENGTILKTTNGGLNWAQLPSGTQTNLNGICFVDSDNIWVVGGYQYWPDDFSIILNTTNGGLNWTQWIFEDTTSLNDVYFTDINNGWAVGWKNYPNYQGIILRTTNGGTDWIHQTSGTHSPINAIQFIDSSTGWAVGGITGGLPKGLNDSSFIDPGLILKTVDGGTNWIKQLDTLYCPLYGISLLSDSMGFVTGGYTWMASGGAEARILNTTDSGANWISQLDSIGYAFSDIFFTDPNNGWIVGFISYPFAGVVFHTTNGGVTFAGEQIGETPTQFLLSQNYPNPFNPSTKIRYTVPQTSQVQIKIFDVLGNEVGTLVKEERRAGTYELNWNAANLPSGFYFYQLRTGSFVQTKKMILLK